MINKAFLFASALLLFSQLSIAAAEKEVKCRITSHQKVIFKNKCLFTLEPGGSFTLSNIDKSKPLYKNIILVSVDLHKKDVADVHGLTTDGINSRWGNAKRSKRDKACWISTDFKICAK